MLIDIKQIKFIDKNLRKILVWIEEQTGQNYIITSLYRIKDKGVHGTLPLRGTDLRCRNKIIGKQIESLINNTWIYDSSRPEKKCALLHGDGLKLHIHIQTHPKTTKKHNQS